MGDFGSSFPLGEILRHLASDVKGAAPHRLVEFNCGFLHSESDVGGAAPRRVDV
nr:hypothetical protein Iba_chr13dCG10430 [Ipomoea batatas]